MKRALNVGSTTFILFLLLGAAVSYYFGLPYLWVFPTAITLTLGFIFDDTLRWRAVKYDRWQIEDGHLIHHGQDGSARIPLTDIDMAFRRLGSNVVVQLTSGQRIVLRYLPYPSQTAEQINAARPT